MIIFEVLQYPFMQRALLGGLVLGLLMAYMGVFVVLRRVAFFGEGIAHASLTGIAIGILASYNPLLTAIGVAIIFAAAVFYLERKTTIHPDALIGILFPSLMSLGVVLLSLQKGYQPDLISFLFGNILTIKSSELVTMVVFSVLAVIFLTSLYRQIIFSAFDKEGAEIAGINTDLIDFIFYILLAITVVLGVKMLGIILVSALLVIPTSIGKLLARSFKNLTLISVAVAEVVIVGGIALSYLLDIPTGATIILFGATLFFAILFGKRLIGRV